MNSELYVGQAKNKYILDHIPVEKTSIHWLDMVWRLVAGLSWFKLVLIWQYASLSWPWAHPAYAGFFFNRIYI